MDNNNGGLSFIFGMATDQIKAAVAKIKTEFKGLGDAAKAEGVRVEQAFNAAAAASTVSFQNSTASLKDQITQQRQIIREITGDIKQLGIAAADATGGKKADLLGDLKGAKRALAEEQATMIGLQKRQIEGNAAEAASQGGIISSIGKWAIGLATVAAATEVFKGIMESTERTADVFHSYIKAATEGLNMFYKMIATGDFSNFTENMKNAILAGKEYVYQMSFVANLDNERKLKEIDLNKTIEDNRRVLNANDKVATADKIIAGGKMLEAMKKKGEGEIEVAVATFRAVSDISTSKSKLTEKEIDIGLKNYKVVKEVGEKYAELKQISDDYEKSIKPETVQGIVMPKAGAEQIVKERGAYIAEVRAEMESLNKETAKLNIIPEQAAKIYSGLEDLSDKEKAALTTATAQIGKANLQFQMESKRVYTFTENLKDKDATAAAAAAKKAKDDAELDNRIKATAELMKSAQGEELTMLAKKLVLLEAEKKLRDAIQKSVMAMYANKPLESRGAASAYGAIGEALGGENTQPNSTTQAKSVTDRLKADSDKAMADTIRRQKVARVDTASQEKESEASLKAQRKRTDDLAEGFYLVADAAKNFANIIGDSNKELAGTISAVAGLAGRMGDLVKKGAFTAGGMKPEDAIGAGIGGATQILGVILGQAQANKKAQDEWTASILQAAHAFAMMGIEALAYKEANLFGVENPYSRAIAGAKQYGAAMGEMELAAKNLEGGQVQIGTKKVASGSNVVSAAAGGAVIGAAIGGGVLSVPAAAIGAVIGAAIGFFAAKKTVPVFESLKKQYGEIYNKDTFELNPKILADYGKLDATTKQMVDNWKDIKAAAIAAQDEMIANFKTLAGDLGTSLADSIIGAFRSGNLDNAINGFHTKVGDVIADLAYKMLFNQFMQPFFNKAQEGFNNSFGMITDEKTQKLRAMTDAEKLAKDASGKLIVDGSISDDLVTLADDTTKGMDALNAAMTDADKTLKDKGFTNGLGGSAGAKDNSMKGQITAALTEDTATELKGLWNRQSIDIRGILELGKASSSHLLNIAANTLRTADNTDQLADMKVSLKSIDTAVNKTASRL